MCSANVITRGVFGIVCSAVVMTGCVVTSPKTTGSVCPPIVHYTAADEKQLADELRTLGPHDVQSGLSAPIPSAAANNTNDLTVTSTPGPSYPAIKHWLRDYIAERDMLKKCQTP